MAADNPYSISIQAQSGAEESSDYSRAKYNQSCCLGVQLFERDPVTGRSRQIIQEPPVDPRIQRFHHLQRNNNKTL